jgi:hypothetical protein
MFGFRSFLFPFFPSRQQSLIRFIADPLIASGERTGIVVPVVVWWKVSEVTRVPALWAIDFLKRSDVLRLRCYVKFRQADITDRIDNDDATTHHRRFLSFCF